VRTPPSDISMPVELRSESGWVHRPYQTHTVRIFSSATRLAFRNVRQCRTCSIRIEPSRS
jgi:hypothetical protein